MRKLFLFFVALLWGLPAWGQVLPPGTQGAACLATAAVPSLSENRFAALSCDLSGNLRTSGGGGGGGGSVTQGTNPWVVSGNSTANAAGNPIFTQVTNFPATQPISAASLPLPTGAATAANQNVTAAGTTATSAQAVQGVTGGVPQNVANSGVFPNQTTAVATAIGPTPTTTTGTSVVAKSSAGNLYGFSVTAGGTAMYLAILNLAAAPAGGAAITPLECVPVAVNSYVGRRQDIPDRYTNGIVLVATSSCTTFTAVTPQLLTAVVQ